MEHRRYKILLPGISVTALPTQFHSETKPSRPLRNGGSSRTLRPSDVSQVLVNAYRELAGSNDNERYGDSTYSYSYSCRSAIGRHRENWTYGGYTSSLVFDFRGGAARHGQCLRCGEDR